MDPDALLALLREDMKRLEGLLDPPGFLTAARAEAVVATADRAWQHFNDLDHWIKQGGFVPTEWQPKEAPSDAPA